MLNGSKQGKPDYEQLDLACIAARGEGIDSW